jgi:hypothetical protein
MMPGMMPFNPYNPYGGYYPPPPQEDPDVQGLKKELKKLHKKLATKEHDDVYSGIAGSINALQQKVMAIDHPSASKPLDLMPEERALMNLSKQEVQELQLLSALPRDSEVYRAKMEQYKETAGFRGKMETMLQELQYERLKRTMERDMRDDDQRYQQTRWKDENKRELMAHRGPKNYDPLSGFYVYFDYFKGVSRRFRHCQLVYGIYERGESRLEPRLVPGVGVENDSYSDMTGRAVFATDHDVKRINPQSSLLLIVEVQASATREAGEVSNIGWTVLDLFSGARKLNEGLWKLPLYRPPTEVDLQVGSLRTLLQVPNAFLYIRIADMTHPKPEITDVPVNPDETARFYRIPAIHAREVVNDQAEQPRRVDRSAVRRTPEMARPAREGTPRMYTPSQGNPSQNSGIGVRIEHLQNISSRDLAFQVAVQQGEFIAKDGKGKDCVWNSKPVQITGELFIEVGQEVAFINNFYTLLNRSQWRQPLYLVVQMVDRTQPLAWTVLQLTDADAQSIFYGTVELNLYRPPVTVPIFEPDSLRPIKGSVKLTVFEPISDALPDLPANRRGNSRVPSRELRSEPFIENLRPQYDEAHYFEKGDGVDLYVDGARFLPDNVTCIKLIVKGFNSNLERVGTASGGLPDLDSGVYSPVFGFRTEFRAPVFDPTSTIVVTLVTIDSKHNEVRIVGYSVINLFLTKFRKEAPTDPNEQDFLINGGNFQLPIYCQEPYRKPPFTVLSFKKLEMTPTATLLVRIRQAARTDDGLRVLGVADVVPEEWYLRGIVVPPPKYEEGTYNTAACMPDAVEKLMYRERTQRRDIPVREATVAIQNQLGYRLDLSDDETLEWIDSKLQVTPRTPLLNMIYFARYNPPLGFRFVVDCIHNVTNAAPHVVLFGLNPPGALYQTTVVTQDVMFTTRYDWNSSSRTPQFLDGFMTYKNIPFERNLHVLIDVRSVDFSKQKPLLQPVGWTFLPVFSQDGYVASGIYQLPLIKGAFPSALVGEMVSNSPFEYITSLMSQRGGQQLTESTSVIVRLVDTQRDGHFITPMEVQRLNYEFIPKEALPRFAYNSAAQAKGASTKRLKTIIPGNGSPEVYQKKVNEAIVQSLGLTHVSRA